MSCPHASTTTLLWLYGEAPDAHSEHVASCPDCQRQAALYADVIWQARGLRRRSRRNLALVSALLLAAILLLSVRLWPRPPAPAAPLEDLPLFHSALDDRIGAARLRIHQTAQTQPLEVLP